MRWIRAIVKKCLHIALIACFFNSAFAADAPIHIPASTMPGVMSKILAPQAPAPKVLQPIATPKEKPSPLAGKAAQEVKFQLNGITLLGNTVYTEKQLASLYQDKIGKLITIAELEDIVQSITNYYRNNGYILTRAVLPPQHVSNGKIFIRVIEGYIDQVHVVGTSRGAKEILEKYGDKISKSRPLQLAVMEYYLRIANEVPGVQVKAVLEASKTKVGASDLNMTTEEHIVNGFVSYDDYGTRYIGPQQLTGSLNVNSVVQSGDTTRFYYITTTRTKQLHYVDISYKFPLGSEGVTFTAGGNNSYTRPGLNLALLKINGTSETYYGTLSYPLIRSRTADLSIDGGFNYMDTQSTTTAGSTTDVLYTDHIRSVKFGGSYNFSDRFLGANYLDMHWEEGLDILGATHDVSSTTTSRFGGYGMFQKTMLTGSRLQQLKGPFSLYILANGQYSFEPLLSSEQYSFGGSQLGRGYNPAEIIGDRGVGGTVELRCDLSPGKDLLQAAEPYLFYDAGIIWNMKNVSGIKQKSSITSIGMGVRLFFTQHLYGNLMIAQPLTKQNSTEQVLGNGRKMQGYFSLTANL